MAGWPGHVGQYHYRGSIEIMIICAGIDDISDIIILN